MQEKLQALIKHKNQEKANVKPEAKKDAPAPLFTKNENALCVTNLDNSKSMQENSKEGAMKSNKYDDLSNILKLPLARLSNNLEPSTSQKSPARIFSAKEPTNTQGGSKLDDALNFKSMKFHTKNYHGTVNEQTSFQQSQKENEDLNERCHAESSDDSVYKQEIEEIK